MNSIVQNDVMYSVAIVLLVKNTHTISYLSVIAITYCIKFITVVSYFTKVCILDHQKIKFRSGNLTLAYFSEIVC